MTYGLRIVNDDAELLVDSEYFSPSFVQKLEFSTTVVATEAPTGQLHPGYVKRTYNTPEITAPGNYIVMWTIPDNGNDVWYSFETSTTTIMGVLTCYVYANSTGSALSYTLPTAYLFTTDSLPDSTGYGLRLYNASGTKTFDSNNLQLAPYSISDSFAFSIAGTNPDVYGATPVSISLSMPASPIFMIPDYAALRIKQGSGFARHDEYVYQSAFKRSGTSLSTRLFISYYALEDYFWPSATTTYTTGKNQDLSVLVADANLYEAASGGGGSGTTVTYSLQSSATSTNEGTSVTITLNTTNVADGAKIYYTVTGVSVEDLTAGGTSGYFSVSSNTATATFTFANDYWTEGNEVFLLSLDGLPNSISVTVNDTSLSPSYSWSTPGSVNEGGTGYTTFNATNANGKTVIFSVIAPSAASGLPTISGPSDGALLTGSWTVSGNAATSINVQYSAVADQTTEGPEGFRLVATVDGIQVGGTSGDITVNDTSKTVGYSLAATDNWNESNTYPVTINANNVNGTTLYLTTNNELVTPASSTVTVNSDSFTTNVNFTAGIATANATVRISLRTGSASGTEVAFKEIILTNVTPTYSFGAVTAFNEGSSGSVQFNYSYAANTTFTFEVTAPSTGANGSGDVTLTTTTHSVGATNASGSVTVSYSAGADSTTEGAEYFRINAKVGTSVVTTSENITISDTSVYPAAGTAIGSPYCVVGTYTLRQVRANGSGGTYNDDTLNSPTCGYVAPSYSFTSSVTSVNEGGSFTITLNTNQSGSFPYTITGVSSADINGASLTGSLSNGGVLTVSVSADATTENTETFTITLNNGLATKSVTINDTSQYPAYGTYITQYCSGYNLYYTYANGSGGTYSQLYQANSSTCGYVAPTYSLSNTFSGTLVDGGAFNFYHNSNNANGTTISVTVSGTGASRVSVSPTSWIVSGSTESKLIGIVTTAGSPGEAAKSVTISFSSGQSMSFTLAAVPTSAPTVTSVTHSSSAQTIKKGETITAIINMSGPITANTYVKVAIWLNLNADGSGGFEAGNNIFQGGQTIAGIVGEFPIGTYAGYWTTGANNTTQNTRCQIRAKAVDTSGNSRQPTGTTDGPPNYYVRGPLVTLSTLAP